MSFNAYLAQQKRALLCLLFFVFSLHVFAAEYYGAIEIGGKGVKSYVIELDDAHLFGKIIYRNSFNTAPQSGIDETWNMQSSMIQTISSDISTLKKELTYKHHIPENNLFVIGSSAINKIHNKPDLIEAIEKEAHQKLFFIDEKEESTYAFYGAIPKSEWENGAMIDIGGGNTKIAWLDKNAMSFFEIPLGTVSLTKRIAEDINASFFEKACLQEIKQYPVQKMIPDDKTLLFANGGIFWATAYLKYDGSVSSFVTLQKEDFEYTIETFSHPLQCTQNPKSTPCFLLNYYGANNLIAGATLAKETIEALGFFEKKVIFARDGAWVIGWILARF